MISAVPAQASLGLVRTKFYRPALPGDFVERTRLIDQLKRGLDRPLTLVSAPASSSIADAVAIGSVIIGQWPVGRVLTVHPGVPSSMSATGVPVRSQRT